MNAISAITSELNQAQEARRAAERDLQEALALVARHRARVAECDAVLAALRRVIERLDPDDASVGGRQSRKDDGPRITVRSAVQQFFRETPTFEYETLFEGVRTLLPHAQTSTIRAELSRAKSRGDVEQLGDKSWISHVANVEGDPGTKEENHTEPQFSDPFAEDIPPPDVEFEDEPPPDEIIFQEEPPLDDDCYDPFAGL
jgi:hypothetical protein